VLECRERGGHQIRVASLQTKYTNDGQAPAYDGVKVLKHAWLASDYIGASGRFSRRILVFLQMANGDKIVTHAEGCRKLRSEPTGEGGHRLVQLQKLTGGTGKFATIRGTLRGMSHGL